MKFPPHFYIGLALLGISSLSVCEAGPVLALKEAAQWEILPGGVASAESLNASGYIREATLLRPIAATTAAQLEKVNPGIGALLPGFAQLMKSAEVSSRYVELYDRKVKAIKSGAEFTRHNYLDCETILRLEHPKSGRKVLLLQSDMDVVTDGSDGRRSGEIGDYDLARTSDWYLPETAYGWSGKTSNPFLEYYPAALVRLQAMREKILKEAENDPGVIWREMLQTCDDQIYRVKARGLGEGTKQGLATRRFLLAERDPFVVLPKTWAGSKAAWAPRTGDFAVVIHGGKAYPAILGDYGPADKIGEASLCLARALNPAANGKTRAVSDLSVTYLYFPQTALPFGEPNHQKWREHCQKLLNEIGGLAEGAQLHRWPEG